MATYRILFITDRFPPSIGGVSVSAERMTRLLAARGHLVHVLHLNADVEPGAVQSVREGDVMVHRLGGLEGDDVTCQFADNVITHLHARVGFELFHGHGCAPAGYLAALYATMLGARSMVSIRGNDVARAMFRGDQLPLILWTLQHAGAVGCVSRELVAKCQALSGRTDIRFTPNSVELDIFTPQPKDAALCEALGIGEEIVLGFVGELRYKKGTHFILDAFRAVREQHPASLLLVGGMRGEDRLYLRRFLRHHPALRAEIHVVDYVHDRTELASYYQLLDLVLAPSLWDGMPNSVLEAMACGRPVLATNVGGIRDVIRHGDSGVLLDVHELPRLGEGCLELLAEGPAFREALGTQARRHIEQHHTPEREVTRVEEIYDALMPISQ